VSDFSPLLLGNPDEFEALLLHSADDDEPADGALEKVGLALGLSASALAVVAGASAMATPAAVAGPGATLAQHLGLASLAKWLGVGIAAGLVTGGAAHWAAAPASPPAAQPIVAVAALPERSPSPGVAPVRAAAPSAPVNDPPAESSPELPAKAALVGATPSAVEAAPPAVVPRAETSPEPASAAFAPLDEPAPIAAQPASSLGDETKALDRVRESLAAARPVRALAEIDRYRAQWPRGALAAEAALLRVDALLRSGNRAAAEAEANGLITRAPQSRYATRARALLGDAAK
jgi:hypothetical protein